MATTWRIDDLIQLNNKFKPLIENLGTYSNAIKSYNEQLKSIWVTNTATQYYAKMDDFYANMTKCIESYEDISKDIEIQCQKLQEID